MRCENTNPSYEMCIRLVNLFCPIFKIGHNVITPHLCIKSPVLYRRSESCIRVDTIWWIQSIELTLPSASQLPYCMMSLTYVCILTYMYDWSLCENTSAVHQKTCIVSEIWELYTCWHDLMNSINWIDTPLPITIAVLYAEPDICMHFYIHVWLEPMWNHLPCASKDLYCIKDRIFDKWFDKVWWIQSIELTLPSAS